MIEAITKASKRVPYRLLKFVVAGVSVESNDVQIAIFDFLSGKVSYTGTTDPNHNAKSWRYQLIGGSKLCYIGRYVLDAAMLPLLDVNEKLLQIGMY